MSKVNILKCEACQQKERPCLSTIRLSCPGDAKWVVTDKYQITKTPDPVYIVQIPETCNTVDAWIVAELRDKNLNGLPIGKDFTGNNRSGNYSFSDIPEYCLKQKPAKQTAEELQERIDGIERIACGILSDDAFRTAVLSAVRGEE